MWPKSSFNSLFFSDYNLAYQTPIFSPTSFWCVCQQIFNHGFFYTRVSRITSSGPGMKKSGATFWTSCFLMYLSGLRIYLCQREANQTIALESWILPVKSHIWIPLAYHSARHFINSSLGKGSSVSADYKRLRCCSLLFPLSRKCLCDTWRLSRAATCFCNIVAASFNPDSPLK